MNKIQSMPRYFNADKISQQYLARDAQTISMVADGLEVLKINASFSPQEFSNGSKASSVMDRWKVTLTNPRTEATMTVPFGTGTGHRVFNDISGMRVPVHPLISDVIGCIGLDADTYAELPKGDDAALEYLQSELGYETVPKARKILNAIFANHEKLEGFLKGSGASMEDFIAWSHSEQVEGYGTLDKGEFLVFLPEVVGEGNVTYKGALRVGLSSVSGGSGLTTALEPRPADAQRLSAVSSIWTREEGDKFFSFQSSGPSMEVVLEQWSEVPEVLAAAELAKRWHLNDLNAGTDSQKESLNRRFESLPNYEKFKAFLAEDGLLTDRGYTYGSQWLLEVLPDDVVETVLSWRDDGLRLQEAPSVAFKP